MIWLVIFIAAVFAAPFLMERMRKQVTAETRANAPGQMAKLPQGVTHYQWHGPADGPLCVCIHGLTTPSFVWGGLAPALVKMGFRVLTYDHYGRGFSDRPDGAQTTDFFLAQLNDLLHDQGVADKELTVVGYSMGGVIATAFAARAPARTNRVVLLAPAGMSLVGRGLFGKIIRTPVIGRWIMFALYPSVLRKGFEAEKDLPSSVPDITNLQEAELARRGFLPAVHSSMCHVLSGPMRAEHVILHEQKVPVLAIWGINDDVIPVSSADTLKSWNSDTHNALLAGAGHGLTYTHTDDVAALIQDFYDQTR